MTSFTGDQSSSVPVLPSSSSRAEKVVAKNMAKSHGRMKFFTAPPGRKDLIWTHCAPKVTASRHDEVGPKKGEKNGSAACRSFHSWDISSSFGQQPAMIPQLVCLNHQVKICNQSMSEPCLLVKSQDSPVASPKIKGHPPTVTTSTTSRHCWQQGDAPSSCEKLGRCEKKSNSFPFGKNLEKWLCLLVISPNIVRFIGAYVISTVHFCWICGLPTNTIIDICTFFRIY